MCNKTKQQLLTDINQYTFMLDDITLFLDTHPCCEDAMEAYNTYKKLRLEAMRDYTENYGALCRYNVDTDDGWSYINQPWPWEGECGR